MSLDWDTSEIHIRRERERARELRLSRWWQTRISQGGCHYCGLPMPKGTATMDHLVPVSRGGTSTRGNVVPACRSCNTKKRDATAAEFALDHRT